MFDALEEVSDLSLFLQDTSKLLKPDVSRQLTDSGAEINSCILWFGDR